MEIEPKEKAEQLVRYSFDEVSDFMDWEKAKICDMKVANECLDISYGMKTIGILSRML